MKRELRAVLEIVGAAVGIYLLLPDATFFLSAAKGTEYLTFQQAVAKGGHALPPLSLVLLPVLRLLKKLPGTKLRSALAVLVFAGLSVVLGRVLHPFVMDLYAFLISVNKIWLSITGPVVLFAVVAANWAVSFAELYSVTKVAGE